MKIIENVLGFLRTAETGSEALRRKLQEVAAAIPDAEAEAARLAAERAAKLLSATEREIEQIERAEADARRAVDRLNAAREEIARRLSSAEADEAKAKLDSDRAEAERLAEATAERVRREYARAAKVIAGLVADLDVAEKAVVAVNARLEAAGRLDDLLRPVESRAIPEPAEVRPEPFKLYSASLPPAPGFGGLGLARDRAEVAGIIAAQLG